MTQINQSFTNTGAGARRQGGLATRLRTIVALTGSALIGAINNWFQQVDLRVSAIALMAVAVLAAEAVALSINAVFYGADPLHVAINALVTTTVVSVPLIALCLATIKNLDRSKNRYREMRNRALAESEAKSRFLANMSHELRTPLNAILGFSDAMQHEIHGRLGSPKYGEYVNDIKISGSHLLNIISEMLEYGRLDAGMAKLNEGQVCIPSAIAAAVRIIGARSAKEQITINVAIDDDLPVMRADDCKLRQMVLNLLSNATKFTPRGGQVTVRAGLAFDGDVRISVTDNGIGIAAEDITRVLEPFGQVENVLVRRHGGVGLGLPLVKAMMELHGGTLRIDSSPGKGTTASLTFPKGRIVPAAPEGRNPALTQSDAA